MSLDDQLRSLADVVERLGALGVKVTADGFGAYDHVDEVVVEKDLDEQEAEELVRERSARYMAASGGALLEFAAETTISWDCGDVRKMTDGGTESYEFDGRTLGVKPAVSVIILRLLRRWRPMRDPEGPTGEMPSPRGYTVMHPTASCRRSLITESDGTHTSKCPYMGVCNQPRRMGIMDAIRGYSVDLRCTLHNTLSCTLEVVP